MLDLHLQINIFYIEYIMLVIGAVDSAEENPNH